MSETELSVSETPNLPPTEFEIYGDEDGDDTCVSFEDSANDGHLDVMS